MNIGLPVAAAALTTKLQGSAAAPLKKCIGRLLCSGGCRCKAGKEHGKHRNQ